MALQLQQALQRREFAALRVIAAAVALCKYRRNGTPSAGAYLALSDELDSATGEFVDLVEAPT